MKLSTRLTVAMVALVVLTAGSIEMFALGNIESAALPRVFDRIDTHTRLLAVEFDAMMRSARADAVAFGAAAAVDGIVKASLAGGTHPTDGTSLDQWRERLATRFAAELAAKPAYRQFRLIGAADGGREIVRVDRAGVGDAVRIVSSEALQRQGERPYVQRTLALAPGAVDVSPVQLNREFGSIEIPHVPVVHVSSPIPTPDGRLFGLVTIEVDLRPIFAQIRSSAVPFGQIFVVNERGDYLIHQDRNREFGFETGKSIRIQDDFSELNAPLALDQRQARIIKYRGGEQAGAALIPVQLGTGSRVTLVQTLPYSQLVAASKASLEAGLLGGLVAVLIALVFAVIVARSLTSPLVQMTAAVEGFSRGSALALPANASGEIGVLSRAFARMVADMQDKNAALTQEVDERRRIAEVLNNTITSIVDPILVCDEFGKIVIANGAAKALFTGLPDVGSSSFEDAYERLAPDGVTPMPYDQSALYRAMHGEFIDNLEFVIRPRGTPNGLHLVAKGGPIKNSHGAIKGAVVVYRDVTGTKDTERALRQAQKMEAVGQLTGGIAHDFNNVLTVITGTIDVLIEGLKDRPNLAAIARLISRAADGGAELTRRLLAFARKQPLQPRVTDVNTLIVESVRLLHSALGEHIEVEAMLEENAWPALVDPSQLTTALVNLAVNARDAMPEGGKLMLESSNVQLDEGYAAEHGDVAAGPYVMIAVSDTGSGIPATIRDKVFEPFFTTKGTGKGTGLGLSMVYGFVKQSGGHIKLYSEEGHGTTIKIYLPRAAADLVDPAERSAELESQGGTETILIVEDDPLVLSYVTTQLHDLGYRTRTAANAADALAIIDTDEHIDLLFTDVIMPGTMNGRQLAEEATRRRPGLHVLFTSGYTENAIVHHGRLDPGVLLLEKPYRKSALARMVRVAMVKGSEPLESTEAPLQPKDAIM